VKPDLKPDPHLDPRTPLPPWQFTVPCSTRNFNFWNLSECPILDVCLKTDMFRSSERVCYEVGPHLKLSLLSFLCSKLISQTNRLSARGRFSVPIGGRLVQVGDKNFFTYIARDRHHLNQLGETSWMVCGSFSYLARLKSYGRKTRVSSQNTKTLRFCPFFGRSSPQVRKISHMEK